MFSATFFQSKQSTKPTRTCTKKDIEDCLLVLDKENSLQITFLEVQRNFFLSKSSLGLGCFYSKVIREFRQGCSNEIIEGF